MKKKKKSVRKVDESKAYQLLLKKVDKTLAINGINMVFKYDYDDVIANINIWKELLYNVDGEYLSVLQDKYPLVEYLDYIVEAVFLYKNKQKTSEEVFAFLREKVLIIMEKYNFTLELLIATGRMSCYCSQIHPVIDKKSDAMKLCNDRIVVQLGVMMFYIVMYHSVGKVKIKNKLINRIVCSGDRGFNIEYREKPFLLKDEVMCLQSWIKGSLDSNGLLKVREVLQKVGFYYNEVISSYCDNDFCYDIMNIEDRDVSIDLESIRTPLLSEDSGFMFDENELLNIYSKRKYLYPKAGIIFDVKDSDSDVSKIRMLEDSSNIYLVIYVRNKGNIDIVDRKTSGLKIQKLIDKKRLESNSSVVKYGEEVFPVKITVNKMILKSKAINAAISISKGNVDTKNIELFNRALKVIALSCIYCAYCDPTLFRNSLCMYGVARNSAGCITKTRYFKVAYIRRLPNGQKMSADARKRAEVDGFKDIPTGYTFVSCSNRDLEYEAKVKKITIKSVER